MKVTCEIELGNDGDMVEFGLPASITVEGEPYSGSGFVTIRYGSTVLDVRPKDLREALRRCESGGRNGLGGIAA